ncbi:MAG: RpiB/LacA/LacB family sugar-phosphate isomerase [Phycisphaerae bacterium]|nr:RpiB/LacA/LacB family sugar-phosphate isomerase [Planctomycetota bacterium]MBL7219510.1 RpiB/LacA/LacB family sugar-phosphate isomerase [Phycisphaerae bacterium]
MDRRQFLQAASATLAAATIASSSSLEAAEKSPKATQKEKPMNIVVAADPFALDLKDSVIKHLTETGHKVTDVGATKDKEIAYYDGAAAACKVIQAGKADRGVLFCGTGMGMSIVANKFKGVTASCVESVYAAQMSRAINDSNVLTMGAMFIASWKANAMVDAWMNTKHTEGLEGFADFLKQAVKKVDAIDQANLK